jgi:hypothetical protein
LVFGQDDFASLILLELNVFEEVNNHSFSSGSSLLVVKLISVERMDSAFLVLFLLLAVFSGFNCLLSALIYSKRTRKAKDIYLGPTLFSKQAFFCYLNLAISLQSAVLWLFFS